jgi:hypothetical protein
MLILLLSPLSSSLFVVAPDTQTMHACGEKKKKKKRDSVVI